MNELQVFKNQELGLQARTITNPDGSISINAEDTAIGFGWTQTQNKNGKQYISIRWETLNGYCREFGFPNKLGKDDYIPESLFYRLGMKANNAAAEKFQNWLAFEVIPSIRKTGSYEISKEQSDTMIQFQELSPELQAIFAHDKKIQQISSRVDAVNKDLQQFKEDMPILGIEESKITNAVKKKGVNCLGGKSSNAYNDRKLRTKLYMDIYRQLYRQFGITTYRAIKRNQCDFAIRVIEDYEPPYILGEQIHDYNAQVNMEVAQG